MYSKKAILEGSQELTAVQSKDFNAGNLFARIIDSVNSLAKNVGAAAVGKLDPPPPVNSIQVQGTQAGNVITCPSEILHLTVAHNGELNKGVQYVHEISTESNFLAPHQIDCGCARSLFVHLPANDSTGKPQAYFHRVLAQYPGSDPNQPTVLGGLAAPTKILMTGSSNTTLLQSTGSGTASPQGTQGGHGLGKVLTRPAPGPQRSTS